MADEQRDVVAEVLAHLGLDPAQVPAATLAAVRATLEGPELSPRELAALVPTLGGVARGGHDGRRPNRRSTAPDPGPDELDPRKLADLVRRELF